MNALEIDALARDLEDHALQGLAQTLQPDAPAAVGPAVRAAMEAFACADAMRAVGKRRR